MSRIRTQIPWLFNLLSIISIVSLFADGANITDPFRSCTTIHFDELPDTPSSPVSPNIQHHGLPPLTISGPDLRIPKPVILDQDGPSEAASAEESAESFSFNPPGTVIPHLLLSEGNALHIRNRTLLL